MLNVKELDRKYLTRGLDSRYGTPKLSERLKISGSVVCYYNNELPEYQVYYIDGILDGEIVSYYPDGNLNAKAKFTMGIPADRMLIYSENGVLENELVYD